MAYVRRRGSRGSCVSRTAGNGHVPQILSLAVLLGGVLIGLVISERMTVLRARAQQPASERLDRSARGRSDRAGPHGDSRLWMRPRRSGVARHRARGPASVQDVLVRPYRFPFNRPTTLAQVCPHLKQTLRVPVVLDIAALGRQDVEPETRCSSSSMASGSRRA